MGGWILRMRLGLLGALELSCFSRAAALMVMVVMTVGGCGRVADEGIVEPGGHESLGEAERLEWDDYAGGADGAAVGTGMWREGREELGLEHCREQALARNLDLQVAMIGPEIAATSVTEAEAAFEALFYSDVRLDKVDQLTSVSLNSTGKETVTGVAGVTLPLKTGGEIGVEAITNRVDDTNQYTTLNPAYGGDLSLRISQPLLRGFGTRVNTHAIRVAKYETGAARAETKLEVMRVLAETERLYWRLWEAYRMLEIRQVEYELAGEQLERVQRRVDAGTSPEVEIIRAETGVAARLETVIQADHEVRVRERALKLAMHYPDDKMGTGWTLVPVGEPELREYELDPNALVRAGWSHRMELLRIEYRLAADMSRIDYFENNMLPLLALDYRYTMNGLGDSYRDGWDMVFENNYVDHGLGLRLEVPLGNQGAESKLRRAMLQKSQRLANKTRRRALIQKEVLDALDGLNTNWQLVLANKQRPQLAERELKAEQRQFEMGLRTSREVLEAQKRYAEAQLAELSAVVAYQLSRVDLAYATGLTLGASKVRF